MNPYLLNFSLIDMINRLYICFYLSLPVIDMSITGQNIHLDQHFIKARKKKIKYRKKTVISF